ncbi:MAG: hypothetical protein Q4C10_11940 [Clostridia bacterium]|nr:hypothetical protein [Clostridia bacterium]
MDSIRMIGYDAVHPSDFVYDVPEGHGYYLLILTHTPLRFRDGEIERIYPAHHAALFSPDCRIHYGACEETYGNDWIIFSSDEPYVTQFPMQNRPFPVPDADYCHNLFQLLTWEHVQSGHEAVTSQLMALLFQKLRAGISQPEDADYRLELTALRRRIMSQPLRNWNVSDMAAQLHISAGYLHLLYKQQFGTFLHGRRHRKPHPARQGLPGPHPPAGAGNRRAVRLQQPRALQPTVPQAVRHEPGTVPQIGAGAIAGIVCVSKDAGSAFSAFWAAFCAVLLDWHSPSPRFTAGPISRGRRSRLPRFNEQSLNILDLSSYPHRKCCAVFHGNV